MRQFSFSRIRDRILGVLYRGSSAISQEEHGKLMKAVLVLERMNVEYVLRPSPDAIALPPVISSKLQTRPNPQADHDYVTHVHQVSGDGAPSEQYNGRGISHAVSGKMVTTFPFDRAQRNGDVEDIRYHKHEIAYDLSRNRIGELIDIFLIYDYRFLPDARSLPL